MNWILLMNTGGYPEATYFQQFYILAVLGLCVAGLYHVVRRTRK